MTNNQSSKGNINLNLQNMTRNLVFHDQININIQKKMNDLLIYYVNFSIIFESSYFF